MREALQAVPESLWEGTDDSSTTRWLPLILVSQTGLWIGLDHSGWVVGRRGGRTAGAGDDVAPAWLPVLDLEPSVLDAEIADAAERHNLPLEALADTLPIDGTITLALGSESQHWIERAVAWLSTRTPSAEQTALLAKIAELKWLSQRTRQQAHRLSTAHGGGG
jgi:hypothetical protein